MIYPTKPVSLMTYKSVAVRISIWYNESTRESGYDDQL